MIRTPQLSLLDESNIQSCTSQDKPWCSTETSNAAAGSASTFTDGDHEAWIPADAIWPFEEYNEIYVKFMNVELLSDWTIDGQTMNKATVLHYANTWSRMGGGKIPYFVEARYTRKAFVRVSFNSMLYTLAYM